MEIIIVVLIGAVAVAAVLYPLLRADATRSSGDMEPLRPRDASVAESAPDDSLAEELALYREALRAGTVCDRCLQANPQGSRYCSECGRQLGKEPVLYGEGDM